MKKFIIIAIAVTITSVSVSADALKNSLTNLMNTDDSTSMVNLSNINLNAKAKPVGKVQKNRADNAVIGTVNDHKVFKKDADGYLRQRTGGKVDNFDAIPLKQQKRLLHELSLPILALEAAQKELTALEKQTVFTRVWMQKEAANINIKDEDIQSVYDQLKQQTIDINDTRTIPPFEQIKEKLRIQMIEKSIMNEVMKDVKIEVSE